LANWTESTVNVAGTELVLVEGGSGQPLLVFHDELGYTGWMKWNEELAKERKLMIPQSPKSRALGTARKLKTPTNLSRS
jgi:hypothetical protein